MSTDNRTIFMDALNTYYRLQNEYNTNFNKLKRKIANNKDMSWREKRAELRTIKRKCINCKRPVGTIFSRTFEDENHKLKAMCGDRQNPCPLNIDIVLGTMELYEKLLQDDIKVMAEYKEQIIIAKNNLLFGYSSPDEAIDIFDTIKEQLESVSESYEFNLETVIDKIDNPQKKQSVLQLRTQLFLNIEALKSMIESYDKSSNVQYVNDAVSLYINDIVGKNKKIVENSYAERTVEYDSDDDTYHLNQQKCLVSSLEFDMGNLDQGVVAFQTGIAEKLKRGKTGSVASKTVKSTGTSKKSVAKTRKNVNLVLKQIVQAEEKESKQKKVEEEEEEEEEEQEEE